MSSQEAAWIIIKLHDERRHSPRSQAQVLSKHRHNPYPTRARSKTITGQTRQAAVCTQNGNNDTDARDTRASPQKEGTPEAVGTTWSTLTVSEWRGESHPGLRLDSWVVGMTTGLLILQRGSNSVFRAANEAAKPAVER